MGGIGRRITVQDRLWQKHETPSKKITKARKGWMYGSSGKVPV
jgi:hypothetical protein